VPVITVGAPTAVAVSGDDAVPVAQLAAESADPVRVYGLPAVVRTPDPTPTTAPDAVHARVLDSAGNFVRHLPRAQGLRWLDEFNTAGSGSIDVRTFSETVAGTTTSEPGIAAGSQVMISVGNTDVFRLVLDAEPGYRIDESSGDKVDAHVGAGALGVLNSGMCIPEYGWRAEGTEERSFDYGSNPSIGGWLVPSEWKTPVGKPVRKSWRWTYKKRHLPKGWPDKRAQWLWWRNPDAKNVANETNYFRSSFTLASARRVKFWICGDDTLEFQVDGEIRATTGPGGWRKPTKVVLHLSAGTHYVAAKVTNTSGSSGNQNRSGFLCSIARIDGDGDVVEWLRRTTPSTWTVRRQRSSAPGWFAAQILRQLVAEQQARGCAGHSPVTFGFTTAADSAGVGWVGRQELSVAVETLALDYIQQMVETGIDVAMTPSLVLHAWRSRGADRSRWVRLNQHDTHALEESGSQPPPIRNVAAARALTGWVVRENAASIAAVGRRETGISLGSSRSLTQTAAAVGSMLPDMADPPQTIEVKISGATGKWQPYRDFKVGDWVGYRAAGATTWTRFRVMSIGGEVNDAGYPDWTIQLYEG
jgi:hypothetical protein